MLVKIVLADCNPRTSGGGPSSIINFDLISVKPNVADWEMINARAAYQDVLGQEQEIMNVEGSMTPE